MASYSQLRTCINPHDGRAIQYFDPTGPIPNSRHSSAARVASTIGSLIVCKRLPFSTLLIL
jgi:hypothetical protein